MSDEAKNRATLKNIQNDYRKFSYDHASFVKNDLETRLNEIFSEHDVQVYMKSGSTYNNVVVELKSEEVDEETRAKLDYEVKKLLGQLGWEDLEVE